MSRTRRAGSACVSTQAQANRWRPHPPLGRPHEPCGQAPLDQTLQLEDVGTVVFDQRSPEVRGKGWSREVLPDEPGTPLADASRHPRAQPPPYCIPLRPGKTEQGVVEPTPPVV